MQPDALVKVGILALIQDQSSRTPIVVLHDQVGSRLLPIWIGENEARAIDIALNNVATPRPLTHKLIVKIVEQVGATLACIVIDRLKQHTYHASVHVQTAGSILKIDSRPSDAIALALEARVPIYVCESVMKAGAQPSPFATQSSPRSHRPGALKKEFTPEEAVRLKELLDRAREREQKSG